MNRRSFLRGAAATLAAPLVPTIAIGATAAQAAPYAAPLLSFAVGVDDDWNWRPIKARTIEEAREIWLGHQGNGMVCEMIEEEGETEPCGDCNFCMTGEPDVIRHPEWDKFDAEIGDAQWAGAGYGACCLHCKEETFLHDGGRINADGRLICEGCADDEDRQAALRPEHHPEPGDSEQADEPDGVE